MIYGDKKRGRIAVLFVALLLISSVMIGGINTVSGEIEKDEENEPDGESQENEAKKKAGEDRKRHEREKKETGKEEHERERRSEQKKKHERERKDKTDKKRIEKRDDRPSEDDHRIKDKKKTEEIKHLHDVSSFDEPVDPSSFTGSKIWDTDHRAMDLDAFLPQEDNTSPDLTGAEKNGTIGNETWDAMGSPYWITDNLTVQYGSTLTILPGTRVIFNGSYSIFVEGKLEAVGTSGSTIDFTSNIPMSYWNTIRFNSTGRGNVSYCDIKSATYGLTLDNSVYMDISNNIFHYIYENAIYSTNPNIWVEENIFVRIRNHTVVLDVQLENPGTSVMGDIVILNNTFFSPLGIDIRHIRLEDPVPNSDIQAPGITINSNNFSDQFDLGGCVGILISDCTVTNMTGGSLLWNDIIIQENTMDYPERSLGGIGIFAEGPSFLSNLTDVSVDIHDVLVSDNDLSINGSGMFLGGRVVVGTHGNTDVHIGHTVAMDNNITVSNTSIFAQQRYLGVNMNDNSTIDAGHTSIYNNKMDSRFNNSIEIDYGENGCYMRNQSSLSMGGLIVSENNISRSGKNGIMLDQFYRMGFQNYDDSNFSFGDMEVCWNNINSTRTGIYIDEFIDNGYLLYNHSEVGFSDFRFNNNTIFSAIDYGIFVSAWTYWGANLNGNSEVTIGHVQFNNNTIEAVDDHGIYIDDMSYLGYQMNPVSAGTSSFTMGDLEVCYNNVTSGYWAINIFYVNHLGEDMYNNSRASFGKILINHNWVNSSWDGIHIDYIGYFATDMFDNATATFDHQEVNDNTIFKSGGNAIYIEEFFYEYGTHMHNDSKAVFGHGQINGNIVHRAPGHGLFYGGIEDDASWLYDNASFSMQDFELCRNVINSTAKGIYIEYIERFGFSMNDNSSASFGDLLFNFNNVSSGDDGIYLSDFSDIGNNMEDNSSFDMGTLEACNNQVNSSGYGMYIGDWNRNGYKLYDHTCVEFGDFLFNNNTIFSNDSYGIYVYDWTYWGAYLHDYAEFVMGHIQLNDNIVETPNNFGIYIDDIASIGNYMNEVSPGATMFSMGNCEVCHNNITSGRIGLYLDDYANWGAYMYNNSQASFGDILANENWINSKDHGIFLYGIEYLGYNMYDNASAVYGHQEMNNNTIFADFYGVYTDYLFYENGHEMNGNSTAVFGHCQVNRNDIRQTGSYGIYFSKMSRSGAYMYNEAYFSMENFEISHNIINSTSEGLYIEEIDYLGYEVYDNSRANFGDFLFNDNTINSDAEGINIDYIQYWGYYMYGNSSANFGDFQINHNDITTGDYGIYLYYFYEMAYDINDNSSFTMGNFEMCYNNINSTYEGIYIDYVEYVGEDIYGTSSVVFGDFLFNSNTIISGDDGIEVYDFNYIGYEIYDNSTFEFGNIEMCNNTIDANNAGINFYDYFEYLGSYMYDNSSAIFGNFLFNHNNISSGDEGIYMYEFSKIAYRLYYNSSFSMGNFEVCNNDINSTDSGMYLNYIEYWGYNINGESSVGFGDILINENRINSSDAVGYGGIEISEVEYMANDMYDNSTATFGNQEINDNIIYQSYDGLDLTYLFSSYGRDMHDNSSAVFGDSQVNGNEVRNASNDGIYIKVIRERGDLLYGNASVFMEDLEVSHNKIDSSDRGIYFSDIKDIGSVMQGNSSVEAGDILMTYNNIISGDDGLYISNLASFGYEMYDNSTAYIESLTISDNTIDAAGLGIYLDMSYMGYTNYNYSQFTMKNIDLNRNDIVSGMTGMEMLTNYFGDIYEHSYLYLPAINVNDCIIHSDTDGFKFTSMNSPFYKGVNSTMSSGDLYFQGNDIWAKQSGVTFEWSDPNETIGQPRFYLSDTTINGDGNSTGLYMNNINESYLYEVDMDNFAGGLITNNSNIQRFENGSISNVLGQDMALSNDSYIYTLNTTFNQTAVYYEGYNSTLDVGWYMNVVVVTQTGVPVPYPEVLVKDVLGTEVFNGTADSDGEARFIECRDHIENKTGVIMNYNDYTANASKGGINGSATPDPTMNMTKQVIIVLQDDTFPSISDNTTGTPTTGDLFTIDAVASDNIEVADVYVEYYFDTTSGTTVVTNSTMTDLGGGDYTLDIGTPNDALTLYYTLYAKDTSNNWVNTTELQLSVTDNDAPSFIDDSPTAGTTGDPYTFDINTTDNIEVSSANISWSHGALSGNLALIDDGDGTWSGTIILDHSLTSLDYRVQVNDTSGNHILGAEQSVTVTDNDDPTADAGPDRTVDEDISVTFNGSGSWDNTGIVNYTWTIEGAEYYGMTVVYTFDQPGYYTVELNVTDASGNHDTDVCNVTAEDVTPPTADAGPDQTVDEDTSATFNGSSSMDNVGIVNYTWTIEGTYHYGEVVQYTFAEPGSYVITLNVTDAAGNHDTDVCNVTVEDVTAPTADAGPDQDVNEGSSVTLDASGSSDNVGIANYTWSVDGTRLYGEVVQYTFTSPGNYEVILNVTDDTGNHDTDTCSIAVNGAPDAPTDPTPIDGATDVSTSPVLSVIISDPDGDSMNVTFYDASDDSVIGTDNDVADGGTAEIDWTGLSESTEYRWYAVADDGRLTTQSTTWSFTTSTGNSAPDAPSNPSPEDGAMDVNTSPILYVSVSDSDGDTMTVTFYDASDDSVIGSNSGVADGDRAQVAWSGLALDTEYTWYAVANDSQAETTSAQWSFTTTAANQAPSQPSNPSPEDGASDIGTSPTLSVDVSDADGDTMNVTFYDALDDSIIDTANDIADGDTASVTWSSLSTNTTYEWYAVADDGTDSTASETWSFTTMMEGEDTEAPEAVAKANETTINPGDTVHFDGSDSTDNIGIVSYTWTIEGEDHSGEELNYTFDEVDNYTVTLSVEDAAGNSDTDEIVIHVVSEEEQDTDGDGIPDSEDDDDDNDGMPDEWELDYDLDPKDSSDAGEDYDDDGYTNKEEYDAGTDPTDEESYPTEDIEGISWMMYLIPLLIIVLMIIGVLYWRSRKTGAEEEAMMEEEPVEEGPVEEEQMEETEEDIEEPETDEEEPLEEETSEEEPAEEQADSEEEDTEDIEEEDTEIG